MTSSMTSSMIFSITSSMTASMTSSMIPSMTFEGPIELTARLDGDGNASTRTAGDRATGQPVAVAPGDAGVTLRLQ